MKKRNFIITAPDHARLTDLIAFGILSLRERYEARTVADKLERAEIVAPEEVPPDVITMNSRAKLLDLETGETVEFSVASPEEADLAEGKISVLAPLGSGLLGCRVGDNLEGGAAHRLRRLKVVDVTFQPEAALTSRM